MYSILARTATAYHIRSRTSIIIEQFIVIINTSSYSQSTCAKKFQRSMAQSLLVIVCKKMLPGFVAAAASGGQPLCSTWMGLAPWSAQSGCLGRGSCGTGAIDDEPSAGRPASEDALEIGCRFVSLLEWMFDASEAAVAPLPAASRHLAEARLPAAPALEVLPPARQPMAAKWAGERGASALDVLGQPQLKVRR